MKANKFTKKKPHNALIPRSYYIKRLFNGKIHLYITRHFRGNLIAGYTICTINAHTYTLFAAPIPVFLT
jgi:hypothetical protein